MTGNQLHVEVRVYSSQDESRRRCAHTLRCRDVARYCSAHALLSAGTTRTGCEDCFTSQEPIPLCVLERSVWSISHRCAKEQRCGKKCEAHSFADLFCISLRERNRTALVKATIIRDDGSSRMRSSSRAKKGLCAAKKCKPTRCNVSPSKSVVVGFQCRAGGTLLSLKRA